MGFEGKVVLITGASSGIGADAARHLAKLGAKVAIVGRNEKRVHEVAEEIKKSGSPVPLPIVADVTKDTERIVDETIKHFGQLDVLVNNAGIANPDNVINMTMSNFDNIFDINVRSVIILTKLCVPYLEKTKGNVAALDQFTKCAALDLASKGIRVNSVNPAAIRTPIFEKFGMSTEQIEQYLQTYGNKYPVGRIGDVKDTSAAIAFLANNETASFLTGLLLTCDGGSIVSGTA